MKAGIMKVGTALSRTDIRFHFFILRARHTPDVRVSGSDLVE